MTNETFFGVLLPKVFNTTMLAASLAIYSNYRDKSLLLFGVILGLCVHVILCSTLTILFSPTIIQIILSALIMVLSSIIGYNMTKNKKQLLYRLSLVLLPICFIASQSLDVSLYLIQHQKLEAMMIVYTYVWSIFLCSLYGMVYYYASVTYFSSNVQKCSYSFIIYFTGAIFASNVFKYLDLVLHPPVLIKNIVLTIRESQLHQSPTGIDSQMLSAIFDLQTIQDKVVVGTGYSLYWFILSFCLIYDLKKYK